MTELPYRHMPGVPAEIRMADSDGGQDERHDTGVIEEIEEETKEPEMWNVVLHNDDYTTKVFVVEVLTTVFHKSIMEATKLMMFVHRNGRGVAGTYTWDIAQTKKQRVHQMAKAREYPLRCSIEKA